MLPPATQIGVQPARKRAIETVADLIDDALDEGRDPSWVREGDPDPSASLEGSVVLRHAGLIAMRGGRWLPTRIAMKPIADKIEQPLYDALSLEIIVEKTSRKLLGLDPDNPELGSYAGGVVGAPTELELAISVDGVVVAEAKFLTGYAMLYVQDGATAQTIGTAAAKLSAFTAAAASSGMQSDASNDLITVQNPGLYQVSAVFSLLGTAGRTAKLRVRKNDVEVATQAGGNAVLAATAQACALSCQVSCDANDVLTVWAEADVDATSLTVVEGALTPLRIAQIQ